MTSYLFND